MSTAARPFSPEIADLHTQLKGLTLIPSPRWVRLQVPLQGFSALAWLACQKVGFRYFWRNRQGHAARAGWGQAWEIQVQNPADMEHCLQTLHAELALAPAEIRAYGGLAFPTAAISDPLWQPFGAGRFVIPRFEIVQGIQPLLCLNARLETPQDLRALERALEELQAPLAEVSERPLPALTFHQSRPNRSDWEVQIQALFKAFDDRTLQKAVLAREVTYQSPSGFSGLNFLQTLLQREWPGYLYYFQWFPESCFTGLSPERLYHRKGNLLQTEALAGTRRSSTEKIRQDQWQYELLTHPKERHEHNLVREFLENALGKLCKGEVQIAPVALIKSGPVQHLHQILTGQLKSQLHDGQILSCLHPTPAVGGVPRETALTWLAEHQALERGWYSGPVGWISREEAEFAVALRCLLANRQTLRFYTGVGIVQGSDPQLEWQELNAKLETLLQLFDQPSEI